MGWIPGWYLVRCQQKGWKKTLKSLNDVGVDACCPVLHERKLRKDRANSYRTSEAQAFPGYMFVKFDPEVTHTSTIKRVPGIMDFVHFGLHVHTIKDETVEALKHAQIVFADQNRYECMNMSEYELEKAFEIYQTEVPELRVAKLLALVSTI